MFILPVTNHHLSQAAPTDSFRCIDHWYNAVKWPKPVLQTLDTYDVVDDLDF